MARRLPVAAAKGRTPKVHKHQPERPIAPFVAMPFAPLVASLLLVVRPGAPSSVCLLGTLVFSVCLLEPVNYSACDSFHSPICPKGRTYEKQTFSCLVAHGER